MDSNFLPTVGRWLVTIVSAIFAVLQPALPYLLICTGFVFLDCYSAWRLAQRVRKAHPRRASGKFRSEKMRHIFVTLIEVYAVVLLVYFAQVHIADDLPVNITKVVAGAVCGWQFWSYLENSASCNGAKWAQTAKKILIDKTERHFDIDTGLNEQPNA
mgnify:FL=1